MVTLFKFQEIVDGKIRGELRIYKNSASVDYHHYLDADDVATVEAVDDLKSNIVVSDRGEKIIIDNGYHEFITTRCGVINLHTVKDYALDVYVTNTKNEMAILLAHLPQIYSDNFEKLKRLYLKSKLPAVTEIVGQLGGDFIRDNELCRKANAIIFKKIKEKGLLFAK